MMKYQVYEEYKDSGVEWVGDIPLDWQALPLKLMTISKVKDGPHETPRFIDEGVPFFSVDSIQNNQLVFTGSRYISREDHKRFSLKCLPKKGDVLLGKAASVGKVAYVDTDKEFNVWSPLAVITPKSQEFGQFIFYSLQSTWLQAQCDMLSNSNTQKNLSMQAIDNITFTFPDREVAGQIANFLDHETAKIDTLIEKQQQLIELLKEKRQAVISHAVTKGLNPHAPMRDSGVEWLGEVPEHWEVSQLKFYTLNMQTGPFGSQLHSEDYVIDGIPLINPAHMSFGEIVPDSKVTVDKETQVRLSRHKLSEGEIIFARRGELGRCAIVTTKEEGWLCGTGSLKAKLNNKLVPEYTYLLITSNGVISELSLESKGSTMDNLNTETLGRIRIPVPPEGEQNKILNYVEDILDKYKSLIGSSESAIVLMQERRTALISAAVTGKIDVRDWQDPKATL
ncbi:MAG: hypothetical protein GQ582_02905 [Methyloprofundus sp.]|nr:hypothetical protein [Methyloprofundus sp.]